MRNTLMIAISILLAASALAADYTVVLRDGTTYKATEKWKVVDGQALITLEGGTQIRLDPRLIDVDRTEQANRLGLGDARLIKVEERTPAAQPQQRSLGSVTTLRRDDQDKPPTTETSRPSIEATPLPSAAAVSKETVSKFQRAYDNVGLFGAKVEPIRDDALRISLTTNNEDEVFKAISATAFMISNLDEIEQVQLLMATLNGGSAGKFEMSRTDAKALTGKHISWQSYYVQKVLY
ncbi:MAG: hypothetical protein KY432_02745 [Acidobacteria bacterium]|nr:hypothetical protein [Acidobacteriota bacterium]